MRGRVEEDCGGAWGQNEAQGGRVQKRTEWGKDHEESFPERGRDLAVVELSDRQPLFLRQVESNLYIHNISSRSPL